MAMINNVAMIITMAVVTYMPGHYPNQSASSATEKVVTLTKQMKIGLCEQVRVN